MWELKETEMKENEANETELKESEANEVVLNESETIEVEVNHDNMQGGGEVVNDVSSDDIEDKSFNYDSVWR